VGRGAIRRRDRARLHPCHLVLVRIFAVLILLDGHGDGTWFVQQHIQVAYLSRHATGSADVLELLPAEALRINAFVLDENVLEQVPVLELTGCDNLRQTHHLALAILRLADSGAGDFRLVSSGWKQLPYGSAFFVIGVES
jgi:hypothetical protein